MGFEQLIEKVHQAEQALEAKERSAAADWRQFKSSWKEGWTPGRIVLGGLISGFALGKLEPVGRKGGAGVLQMITAVSGLFASGSAQAAAQEAGKAAQTAEQVAPLAAAAGGATMDARVTGTVHVVDDQVPEAFRHRGDM